VPHNLRGKRERHPLWDVEIKVQPNRFFPPKKITLSGSACVSADESYSGGGGGDGKGVELSMFHSLDFS
jgi:hypothetical protein